MLNNKQRQQLRKEAHNIKAKSQIGAKGLTDDVIKSISEMFNTQELIKIKVNRQDQEDKNIVRTYADELASSLKAEVVYVVGTTIILYKYNAKLH